MEIDVSSFDGEGIIIYAVNSCIYSDKCNFNNNIFANCAENLISIENSKFVLDSCEFKYNAPGTSDDLHELKLFEEYFRGKKNESLKNDMIDKISGNIIISWNCDLYIINCIFTNNFGLILDCNESRLSIQNTEFLNNYDYWNSVFSIGCGSFDNAKISNCI